MAIEFYSAAQSRAIDRFAIEQHGLPGLLLMKRAGLFAFETLRQCYPQARKLLVLCGAGNNGGDGLIVAQLAAMAGMKVTLHLTTAPQNLHGDAAKAYRELNALGIDCQAFQPSQLADCDVVVDALFGIGLNRLITGEMAELVEQVNASGKPVLAIDIASGIHADTGCVLGHAIRAQHTCTFITHKPGLYQYQGADYCGQIHFSDLFLDDEILHSQTQQAASHGFDFWRAQLPPRPYSSHKGSAGSVCLIGGDQYMMGAIQMAGLAALKAGAGLLKILTREEHALILTQALPEAMCYPPAQLHKVSAAAKVIAIGPGLGVAAWGQQLYQQTLALPQAHPVVMDADALKHLAKSPEKRDNWILTPHPGEAGVLLGSDSQEVQQDRFAAIKALQQRYGGVIVLKGNGTLIYDGANLEMCLEGNPGMAVGGMGDILTGIIAGLLAQGLPLYTAACLGVYLHARGGDILAKTEGRGLLPTELAALLPGLLSLSG
ncbi:NAD(P)H-hydrate dehydratase [Thiomicrorhabdus cannonii]|uniref:NAD(P)H-hydrate dehydratase n=1 Tax=Thiomicrorhabdus cannonii TaxID=2748011 RepID=UPI0015C117C3|nr:NAD(P)H-hydrate dehydratase [Thiomicrorhabdus cannonii]